MSINWNKQTSGCDERQRKEHTAALDKRLHAQTCVSAYTSPMDRVNMTTEQQRLAKASKGVPRQELLHKYGPEGAAHMEWIQDHIQASGGYRPRRVRASKYDKQVVLELGLSDSEDDGMRPRTKTPVLTVSDSLE